MSKSSYKYLAKNTILFSISSFGSKVLSFILVPLYTSILSTADYGVVDLIGTAANLLIFAVTICISDGVLRFAIESAEKRRGVFRFGLHVTFIGTTFTGVVLLVISYFNPFGWERYYYLFLYLTVLTNSLNQLISYYLQAIDKVTSVTVMGLLLTICTIISNLILLLVIKCGVVGYLISAVIGSVVSSTYGLFSIYRNDCDCLHQICDGKTKRAIIAYSVPLVFNGIAWWINTSSDRFFIIFYCGYAANGLYAVASKIPTILNMFNSIFGQAWNLSAIQEFDSEDRDGFFRNTYEMYNLLLMGGCSILILLNIPLARMLFSKDFFWAWRYSSLLLIASAFSALSGFFSSIFVAVKKTKLPAISTIVSAFLNILLNWLLVPQFGVLGAAVATVGAFFIVWLTRYIMSLKYLKMRICIVKDLIVYALICMQAVVGYLDGHGYVLQILIILTIALLYYKQLKRVSVMAASYVKKVGGRKQG